MSKENEIKTNDEVVTSGNECDASMKKLSVLDLIEVSTTDHEERKTLMSYGDITIIINPISPSEAKFDIQDDSSVKNVSPGTVFISSKKDQNDETRTIYFINPVALKRNKEISLNNLEVALINAFHEIIDDKQQQNYLVYLSAAKPKENEEDSYELAGVINKVFVQFTSNTGWLVIDYPQIRDDMTNLSKSNKNKDKKKNKKKDKKKKK